MSGLPMIPTADTQLYTVDTPSDSGWRAIFNEATGFEVLDVAMGEAAAVAGLAITPITWKMDEATAYLGSTVTCRKIGEAHVDWPVPLATIERSPYPG